jgi:hypothetical protein
MVGVPDENRCGAYMLKSVSGEAQMPKIACLLGSKWKRDGGTKLSF